MQATAGCSIRSRKQLQTRRGSKWTRLSPVSTLPKPVPDFTGTVLAVSVGLIIWSVLVTFPHVEPFHPNLLLYLTLFAWWTPVLVLASVCAILLLGLTVLSCFGIARPLRLSDLVLAIVTLALFLFSVIYVFALDDRYNQEWVDGRLKMCVTHCGGPFHACVHEPVPMFDARTATERASDAVAFFEASVFGAPMAVVAHLISGPPNGNLQVEVGYGTTGRAECTALVDVPEDDNQTRPFLLAVNGLNAYSRGLAERYGWSPVGLPSRPPAACGKGGLVANEAAAANAVALALQGSLNRDVALYGCSRSGKVANWAAATKTNQGYTHVLVDSGGTLGIASARQVGRCGEPMAAVVERWPSWLAHNASRVRDVRDWPANVDVGDLMLGACAAGTHYAVSTSRHDLWNNGAAGIVTAVMAAETVGCKVGVVLADGYQHCGLF